MKKYVTLVIGGLAVLALGCFWPVLAAEEFKIGFIDLQAFGQKSKKAAQQQQTLMQLATQKQQELEQKKESLIAIEQDLRKQGPLLREDTRNDKLKEMAVKKMELELFEKQAQQQLQNEERDFMQGFQKDLTQIVEKIRKDKKLTLIFNRAALVSVDESLDLTDEAAKEYDAMATTAAKPGAKPGPGTAPPPVKPPAKPAAPAAPAKQPATR
jgi:outer membrane protein